MVRHHFDPPKMEDFSTEEEYEQALEDWEWAEEDYADACRERE